MQRQRWWTTFACLVLWITAGAGCTDRDGRPGGVGVYERPVGEVPTGCAIPQEGCRCEDVGTFVECGNVEVRSGDYVTCSIGKRECLVEHVWGECKGEHVTTQFDPPASSEMRATLASTGPVECVDNPCDPYCYVTEDDGQELEDLPVGTCEAPTGGVVLCNNGCGYTGPRGSQGYSSLPSDWRKLPTSCTVGSDTCGYDSDCDAETGKCGGWSFPCYDPAPPSCSLTKKIDLTLGPPCAVGTTYHFQVCNRGADRADSGSFRIGLYTDKAKITTSALTSSTPGSPNAGYITFTLGTAAGKYIDPGKCIDVTPGNSTASSVNLSGIRAVAVNYNASLSECNLRNNWQVFNPANTCTGCENLECFQTNAATTLTGTIYDPGGVNVVPGVVVYVPNEPVLPLTDGVACDTCSSLFSGTPIASAVTGADGKFTLTNVPAGTNFPLVIQIGRWRRQVTVNSITAGGSAALPSGETSRLPSKKSEGDIPKIAVSMSAGDHLQCLLRKIGIEDSEFTAPSGNGRIHLYAYNGMTFTGTKCTAPLNGTCATDLWSSPSALDKYSAILAPCDKNSFGGTPAAYNPYVGCSSSSSSCPGPYGYGAGPYPNAYGYTSFNSAQSATNPLNTDKPPFVTHPDYAGNPSLAPGPTAAHRANLKAYLDKGGRLFATHWMAYFMTHQSYPSAANYVFGDYVDKDRGPPDFPFTVDTSTSLGSTLSSWLGSSTVTFKRWRHLSASVNSPAIGLAYGDSTKPPINHSAGSSSGWGGPMVPIFQFDTPWGVPSANQCGRVVVAQSHVSESTSTSNQQGAFPGACNTAAMTGEEKAFEFLLFSTTQCVGMVSPPATTSPLVPKTVTFDYDSDCAEGTHPEWQYFSWQARVPPSTSISFQAQTADTQGELAAAPKVGAGTATANTTTWTSDPDTVSTKLADNSPPLASRRWLRISATLTPSGSTSPTLTRWRQTYDCKPAE